jgi:hypothetical protein
VTRLRGVILGDRRPWLATRVFKGPRMPNSFFKCLFCGRIGTWKTLLLGPPCCQASAKAPDDQAVVVTVRPRAYQLFQVSKLRSKS